MSDATTVERYRVSVEQYVRFRRDGFVVVRGLVSAGERRAASDQAMRVIASMNYGLLGCAITDPNVRHEEVGGY